MLFPSTSAKRANRSLAWTATLRLVGRSVYCPTVFSHGSSKLPLWDWSVGLFTVPVTLFIGRLNCLAIVGRRFSFPTSHCISKKRQFLFALGRNQTLTVGIELRETNRGLRVEACLFFRFRRPLFFYLHPTFHRMRYHFKSIIQVNRAVCCLSQVVDLFRRSDNQVTSDNRLYK